MDSYCIDFSGIDFISSVTLGKLMDIDKVMERYNKGVLSLSGISPSVYGAFEVTNLNKKFFMYDKVDDFIKFMDG